MTKIKLNQILTFSTLRNGFQEIIFGIWNKNKNKNKKVLGMHKCLIYYPMVIINSLIGRK